VLELRVRIDTVWFLEAEAYDCGMLDGDVGVVSSMVAEESPFVCNLI
jgi:hypothetical protein